RAARGLRPEEASALQSLAEQTQSVAVIPETLDQIAAPPAKHEYLPRERFLLQLGLDQRAQPSEAAPQVGRARRNPNPRVGRQRHHRRRRPNSPRREPGAEPPSRRTGHWPHSP